MPKLFEDELPRLPIVTQLTGFIRASTEGSKRSAHKSLEASHPLYGFSFGLNATNRTSPEPKCLSATTGLSFEPTSTLEPSRSAADMAIVGSLDSKLP